nr:HAMP domain-containing sensor histidine kinase [Acidisarcina polymorpha]
MHGKGGRLLIRSREATDWRTGARGVMMTIADSGTGISPDIIKHIYQAFFTTKGIGGTGLGLWISSEIVERHHGRLLVRSRQGNGQAGTVFELFLPFQGLSS